MTPLSIIIPAWNEGRVLERTLQGLAEVDYDKKACEVIVVAGGEDDTLEVARNYSGGIGGFGRYLVVPQRPHGKNAAIQDGLLRASEEIIVLLDADTLMKRESLKHLVAPLEEGNSDLTIGNPEPEKRTWVSEYYRITKEFFLDQITTYPGNVMALKAELVRSRKDHFFDKTVQVGVDYFLAKKFLEEGLKVEFVKEASVVTCIPSSLRFFLRTETRWLSAYTKIEGFKYKPFFVNLCIAAGLLCLAPFSKWLFMGAVMLNSMFLYKRSRIFVEVLKKEGTIVKYLPGFLLLSYAYHLVGLVARCGHLLGLDKNLWLYQGERHEGL
jgi:cellulose synthase/poly-beta-1,6-N-acetylglucosamine synthase-like glycosyltransferase